MHIAELPKPRVFIAPVGNTRIDVLELASGRGHTHLAMERNDRSATGISVLQTRFRWLGWLLDERVENGVVVMPAGSRARVIANGQPLITWIDAFRTSEEEQRRARKHHAAFLQAGETVPHHIEHGSKPEPTTVFSRDLDAIVHLWTD